MRSPYRERVQVQFEYWKEHGKGNISLRNKIPLVLPFEGFPPMTKQVTNYFLLSFTPEVSGVLLQWLFKEPWMTESFHTNTCHDLHSRAIRHQNGKAKQNMSLRYTCVKKLLKMAKYRCVYETQVNYSNPSYCNKIIRRNFNESFHF